ncbi:Crp/Fnr family transcriptional regulator [Chryseobacterium sp. 1B4]
MVFTEGSLAKFYFQIVSGAVELNNYFEDGKAFIQNIIYEGQSLGEPFLFINHPYPVNAIARNDCKILKLSKDKFLRLFNENTNVMIELCRLMSHKLFYKYILSYNLSHNEPQIRIKVMLEYLRSIHCGCEEKAFVVPFTRQQIADLTGLRVETVIRVIKMAEDNIITLNGRKIVLILLYLSFIIIAADHLQKLKYLY